VHRALAQLLLLLLVHRTLSRQQSIRDQFLDLLWSSLWILSPHLGLEGLDV
jgi:hypothetical protein